MNVAVDCTGSNNQILARHYLRRRANDQLRIDAFHRIGISRLPYLHDAAVLDSDVAFDDAPMIDDHRVRNNEVKRSRRTVACYLAALAHAIANDFTAAKSDLIAVGREVLFDLDDQIGISQTNSIASRWTVEIGISATRDSQSHGSVSDRLFSLSFVRGRLFP